MHYYPSIPFFILTILSTLLTSSNSHRCSDKFQELVNARNLSNCQRLPTLGAELGWSIPAPNKSHHVFRVLFGALMEADGGWLAWGVNPGKKPEMVGTRAVIGIKNPTNGSSYCRSYNLTHETRIGCPLRPTDLEEIKCTKFEYETMTDYHLISASLNLSAAIYNDLKLNIVWQSGLDVDEDTPLAHTTTLMNIDCVETLELSTGKSTDMTHLKIYFRKVCISLHSPFFFLSFVSYYEFSIHVKLSEITLKVFCGVTFLGIVS